MMDFMLILAVVIVFGGILFSVYEAITHNTYSAI
jgi:hypothetical protein